jgi:hypothetical protein
LRAGRRPTGQHTDHPAQKAQGRGADPPPETGQPGTVVRAGGGGERDRGGQALFRHHDREPVPGQKENTRLLLPLRGIIQPKGK